MDLSGLSKSRRPRLLTDLLGAKVLFSDWAPARNPFVLVRRRHRGGEIMPKRFLKVEADDKDQRRDVANRLFARLMGDKARNDVLESIRNDSKAPEPPKKHR